MEHKSTRITWGTRELTSVCLALALLVSGCGNNYGGMLSSNNDRPEISKTQSEFSRLAGSSNLPMTYVSEGKIGVSKVEAALETADAEDVQARAQLSRQSADFGARRTELEAQISRQRSEADTFRQTYNREYNKALAQIKAREAELSALVQRKDIVINSMRKDGDSQESAIIANAREKYESEQARIEQIRGIYSAIEQESNATIMDMVEAAKATRQRAAAVVSELEAQADSVKLETQARVSELEEQIRSSDVQTKTEAERLRVTRESLIRDSEARVRDLRSRAETIQSNLASETYQLKLSQAESDKSSDMARVQEKAAGAPTRLQTAMAEIERLRGEIAQHQENAEAAYQKGIAMIDAKLEDERNEIKKIRVAADRAEQVARAEFVKAEAQARAEAVRQTAEHAEEVAEAQKRQIIAEAEAEAARIKQEVLEEIAAKKRAGRLDIDNKTDEAAPLADAYHEVPEVPQVKPVAPRIEPDHIAAYRTRFAKVMRQRAQADAYEMVAEATYSEAKTNLLAVKLQEDAIAGEKLSVADALEAQARARFKEIEFIAQRQADVVESQYRQSVVDAESFRKEKEAESMELQSQADTLEQIAAAHARQLRAEAEAVVRKGENRNKELSVELWAVQQRGDAQYAKLMTEARTIADAQEAHALQIDAQVDSARKYLSAELSKIKSSIDSAERIAQADYEQAMTQARVLRQQIEAEVGRTEARFAMEHTVMATQIERDKQLALSQVLRSEAAYERFVADLDTNLTRENATIDSEYAAARADLDIVLASNASKRDAAQSYLDAVKARFSARVEQVKAERVIDIAREHNEMALRRTDLSAALAQAVAAREESNQKLSELQKRQASLQAASIENWSAKLARVKENPMEFATLDLDSPVEMSAPRGASTLTSSVD